MESRNTGEEQQSFSIDDTVLRNKERRKEIDKPVTVCFITQYR